MLDLLRNLWPDLDAAGTGSDQRHPLSVKIYAVVTLSRLTGRAIELGHTEQITRIMAKQYTTEIGTWAEFLPIVTDRTKANA